MTPPLRYSFWFAITASALAIAFVAVAPPATQAQIPGIVKVAEDERIAVIAKVKPAVAAVCFFGGKVCGSGVVISDDGLCLTNFHVVQPTGAILQCGLADGKLYDTVLMGQDKVGDVALVKLLPKKPGDKFPFVKLGDSDQTRAGEWSLAMGNPFGLAMDFNPTVTFGLISGVNRYQPPEGKGTLEYTDCIQIDTSINPGNSGGPLFNMKGELIGINGRGSFDKRGRVNSGVGYAISINQIKNFLGHLKVGIDTDHATLGASFSTDAEEGDLSKIFVSSMLDESDAFRRGLKPQDQLVAFAGRSTTSTNQYKNILGIYPKEWRVPLRYRRGTTSKEMLVRLMGNMDQVKEKEPQSGEAPMPKPGQPQPGPRPGGPPPNPGADKARLSPAAKMVEVKKGYANFYFNVQAQDELLAEIKKNLGDFSKLTGDWTLDGNVQLADRGGNVKLTWIDDKSGTTEVKMSRDGIEDAVKPLGENIGQAELALPQGSGGLLATLWHYRILMTQLREGMNPNTSFSPGFVHGGSEPFYPPPADGKMPGNLGDLRVDCDVLKTKKGQFEAKWYFSQKDRSLLGCEAIFTKEEDPCELYFYDFKDIGGVKLPHKIVCKFGDKTFATITARTYTLVKK